MSSNLLPARRRLLASVATLSLIVAACGSGEPSTTPTLATDADTSASSGIESGPAGDVDGTTSEPGSSDEAAPSADSSAEDTPSTDQSGPEAPVENLFPDIDVLNVADGSSVNLAAELGGSERPTLLWFWAPH